MTIIAALLLVALGVAIAEVYNHRIRQAERRIEALRSGPFRLPHAGLHMRPMNDSGLFNTGAPRPGKAPTLPLWMMDEFKRTGQVAARYNKGKWERI